MASMNTRLNLEKLDRNIVQKHGGSKQVGFKQLGPGVETGVHRVHDEKHVWFEVELHGAQGDRKDEVFHVSNDDTAVAQRRLKDNQPKEKTNTDCLVKEQEKEYQTGWKIKMGNVLDSCNKRSTQQCMKSGVIKHLEDITKSTYLVNRSPSLLIGFKKPIYMLGFFCWLASIKQRMLEPVKKMGFNESGEFKKTFICSGVGTGSMQMLHGFEFEMEPLGDHIFEVEPQENVDQRAGLQEVQTQDLLDYHLAHDREQHLASELFGYREDSNEAAFAVAAVEKIYAHESLNLNNTVASTVAGSAVTTTMAITRSIHQATKGLLDKEKGNVLGMEIVRDQNDNTLRIMVSGHIYAVGSQEYQVVCTRPDIASTSVDMLDRSITWYGLILGCAGSLKAKFHHMEAFSTNEARYMTFTEAWKKEIWLKGLLIESRYKLRLVAGIATGALYDTNYMYEIGEGNGTHQYWFTTPPKVGHVVPHAFGLIVLQRCNNISIRVPVVKWSTLYINWAVDATENISLSVKPCEPQRRGRVHDDTEEHGWILTIVDADILSDLIVYKSSHDAVLELWLFSLLFFFFASDKSWVRRDLFVELGFSFGDVELHVSVLRVAMLVTIVFVTLFITSYDGVPASKLHQ
nr:zinc finger, CCHC-type [Tanacetum cinerariifolium]